MTVQAEDAFEIEIKLEATFSKGQKETRTDPAEPDRMEDARVTDLGVPVRREPRTSVSFAGGWDFKSLMDGVNKESPDILKLFENIFNHRQEEILEALFNEVDPDE